MNKQSGNILLWAVLGIVAVGLGAVIVWRYFAATDSLSDAQNSEDTSVVTVQDSISSRTTIPEWGISFGVPASLKDKGVTVEYQPSVNGKPDAVYYRSTVLAEANNTCTSPTEGKSYNQPFMVVSKHTENNEGERNLAVVTAKDVAAIGGSYYFVSTPNIKDCYASQVISPFVNSQVKQAIVDSIKTTE